MDKIEYAQYKKSVSAFFDREGIVNLSSVGETYFSHSPCECCGRPLGGARQKATGVVEGMGDVFEYEVCNDCVYFAEYGRLDDQTMQDIETESVPPVMVNGGLVKYDLIPVSYMDSDVKSYIEDGKLYGRFLTALVSGDLFGAYREADDNNIQAMFGWVKWFHNHTPPGCYGSKKQVEDWCKYRRGGTL